MVLLFIYLFGAMASAVMIRGLIVITRSLVWLSEYITRIFTPSDRQNTVSREEVSAMVQIGVTEGVSRKATSCVAAWFSLR